MKMTTRREGARVKLIGTLRICYYCVTILTIFTLQGQSVPSNSYALRHGIRLQPELDKIDIDAYLKNQKALRIQVQCLIYDGPCDWVGRWLKPRAAAALLGECLLCTEHQKSQLQKIMSFIQVNFPEEFRIGIKKFLLEAGIDIPADSSTTPAPTSVVEKTSTTAAAVSTVIESGNNANSTTTTTAVPILPSTSATTNIPILAP